jgi:23S rRNA pseudouridine1911/1915/1917 synthase
MEKKIFNVKLASNAQENRIDKFLQSQFKKISRSKLQNLIRNGYVKLNNTIIVSSSKKIKENDLIEVIFPLPKETHIKSSKMSLDILYEDADLIIINKSPGVVVHPGAGNHDKTIVNGLLFHCKDKLSSIGGKLRPGIVHRIDKDTSGAIVVAKNDFTHNNLSKQFSNHTIKRIYEAIVWGALKPSSGKINANILRSVKNRQLMAVTKDQNKGKIAVTNYKTLKVFKNSNLPKISFIECKLETGRTHQIRVHMNFKGNPILGDKSYGKSRKKFKNIGLKIEKEINNFKRQSLHAKSLGFIHPVTGKEMFFEAKRPKDFDSLIRNLYKSSL